MRILALALILLAPPVWADRVLRSGPNELRLFDGPCVHGGILGQLRPEYRDKFKKASARVNGKSYYACWIEEDGAAIMLFEDGDQGAWPLSAFKESGA